MRWIAGAALLALAGCGGHDARTSNPDVVDEPSPPRPPCVANATAMTEPCVTPAFEFKGTYLEGSYDGAAQQIHLKIRDEGCNERPLGHLEFHDRADAAPPQFDIDMFMVGTPEACDEPPVREVVFNLPYGIAAPAIIDFRSPSGSCVQVLIGVVSFLPPTCEPLMLE